jgi:ArsR family transcriptional regulator
LRCRRSLTLPVLLGTQITEAQGLASLVQGERILDPFMGSKADARGRAERTALQQWPLRVAFIYLDIEMMMLARYLDVLHVLGDEIRLRLCALLRDRELCVTDLSLVTGIAQPRVSTHLGRLKDAGIVRDRRNGTQSLYSLALDGLPSTAKTILDEMVKVNDPTIEGDRRRLAELRATQDEELPENLWNRLEREYSPGRSWQSLAFGIAALLELGDVLDVGSGDGAAASVFQPYCRSLICIDKSERLVDAAARRLAKCANAQAQVADAQALPFDDESFDTVILFHTLTYADKPATVLAECARVLRSGARLLVLCLDEHEQVDLTTRYGERHPGFSAASLRRLLASAGLEVSLCDVACREAKKPHLQVVLGSARKPMKATRKARRTT